MERTARSCSPVNNICIPPTRSQSELTPPYHPLMEAHRDVQMDIRDCPAHALMSKYRETVKGLLTGLKHWTLLLILVFIYRTAQPKIIDKCSQPDLGYSRPWAPHSIEATESTAKKPRCDPQLPRIQSFTESVLKVSSNRADKCVDESLLTIIAREVLSNKERV